MRKIAVIILIIVLAAANSYGQQLPDIKLATINGAAVNIQQFSDTAGKLVVLSFWATWCIPCINELTAINDNLDSWKANLKFDFFAVSEDDSRTVKRVQPLVNGKNWTFNVLLDINQELKRQWNIANIPYTIVIKKGKIIYRHTGYVAGAEEELYTIMKQNQ